MQRLDRLDEIIYEKMDSANLFIQPFSYVLGMRNPRRLTLAVTPSRTGGAVFLAGVTSCSAEGTCRTGQWGGRSPGAEGTSGTQCPVCPHGTPITVVSSPALPYSRSKKVRRMKEEIHPAGLLS